MTATVDVTRNGIVESRHRVHVAVVDREGSLVSWAGDPEIVSFYRSAAKPFQALPLVEDGAADALGLTPSELALCCGSHSGEPRHLELVRRVLAKAGLDERALECGPHAPLGEEAARGLAGSGREPGAIHNNCSGKHAGMLALAVFHGWPPGGYRKADHPVQRRMLGEISRWCELSEAEVGVGVDGCGVSCFAVPVSRMARSFARLTGAADRGEPPARVVEAMTGHPFFVAGTGRLCTRLMERAGDRVFAKTGAEGVYCAGLRNRGLGVALKVEDGTRRASGVALMHTLRQLGALAEGDLEELASFARPGVENTLEARVGEIRADFELEEAT